MGSNPGVCTWSVWFLLPFKMKKTWNVWGVTVLVQAELAGWQPFTNHVVEATSEDRPFQVATGSLGTFAAGKRGSRQVHSGDAFTCSSRSRLRVVAFDSPASLGGGSLLIGRLGGCSLLIGLVLTSSLLIGLLSSKGVLVHTLTHLAILWSSLPNGLLLFIMAAWCLGMSSMANGPCAWMSSKASGALVFSKATWTGAFLAHCCSNAAHMLVEGFGVSSFPSFISISSARSKPPRLVSLHLFTSQSSATGSSWGMWAASSSGSANRDANAACPAMFEKLQMQVSALEPKSI